MGNGADRGRTIGGSSRDRLLTHVQITSDAVGEVVWEVSIDSTVARETRATTGDTAPNAPGDEALGRSRGGLSTKLSLARDGRGRPLDIVLTPGQRHDSTQTGSVLDGSREPRPDMGADGPRRCSGGGVSTI